MKRCIINYAEGKWYPKGQARLLQSLATVRFQDSAFLFDATSVGDGCPSHADIPYGFKYWALDHVRKLGYDQSLWIDSSFWAVRSLDGLFADLEHHGYLLQESMGYTVGDWTSDRALERLCIDRQKARQIVMHDGGLIGLGFHDEPANCFLDKMLELTKVDGCFQGPWTNESRQASQDEKVGGHRHDMSVGGIIAHGMGMNYAAPGKYWCERRLHDRYPETYFLGQGM